MRQTYLFLIISFFCQHLFAQGYLRLDLPLEVGEQLISVRVPAIGELGLRHNWYTFEKQTRDVIPYMEEDARWVRPETRTQVVAPPDGTPGFALYRYDTGRMVPTQRALNALEALKLLKENIVRIQEFREKPQASDSAVEVSGTELLIDVALAQRLAGIEFLRSLHQAPNWYPFHEIFRSTQVLETLTLVVETSKGLHLIEIPNELLNPERSPFSNYLRNQWGIERARKTRVEMRQFGWGRSGMRFNPNRVLSLKTRFSLQKPVVLGNACVNLF